MFIALENLEQLLHRVLTKLEMDFLLLLHLKLLVFVKLEQIQLTLKYMVIGFSIFLIRFTSPNLICLTYGKNAMPSC